MDQRKNPKARKSRRPMTRGFILYLALLNRVPGLKSNLGKPHKSTAGGILRGEGKRAGSREPSTGYKGFMPAAGPSI
jgi:hypothetical protein